MQFGPVRFKSGILMKKGIANFAIRSWKPPSGGAHLPDTLHHVAYQRTLNISQPGQPGAEEGVGREVGVWTDEDKCKA